MQTEEVKAFKNELRNYNYYLHKAITLSEEIEECYDRLGGVRGIDPSKEPLHIAPNTEMEWRLRDQIETYEAEKARYTAKANEIIRILDRIERPLRMAIKAVYADGQTVLKVSDWMYLSPSGLKRRMDNAIKKALG